MQHTWENQKPPTNLLRIALLCGLAWSQPWAWGQPSGAQAVLGTVQLSTPSSQLLQVRTTNGAGTQHSVVNWQSFGIPAGHTTDIVQPSANSLSINRVVGPDPSQIWGQLRSNGQVLLVNPAGITVGAGAVVDTAAFGAAAMRMDMADAVQNRWRFEANATPSIDIQGTIRAQAGGITLVAPQVGIGASAVLSADQGAVRLLAGQSVDVTGPGLEDVQLRITAPTDAVVNLGRLEGGAVGLFANQLKHSGQVLTQAVRDHNGQVVLKAVDTVQVSGLVRSQGEAGRGGSIQATGQTVHLEPGAVLDASGPFGGGEVLVGGGWQGQDARVANAQGTRVDAGAVLKADATERGDGGTVVVWADVGTAFSGQASAMGGPLGGNGGRIEVSGKQALMFRGHTSTLAPLGQTGWLLLDPADLYIVDNASDAPGGAANLLTALLAVLGLSSNTYVLTADLEAQLANNNVTLQTNVGITNNGDIHLLGNLDWSANTRLALNASHDILLNATVRPAGTAGGLDLIAANNIVQQTNGLVDLSAAPGLSWTAQAAAIGALGAGNALAITLNPGATGTSAAFTATGGGVYVRQTAGTLDLARYQASAPTNQTVALSSAGDLLVSSVAGFSGASGSNLVLGADGAIAITPGVGGTFRAVDLTAGGVGGIAIGSGSASNWTVSNGLSLTASTGNVNLAADLVNTTGGLAITTAGNINIGAHLQPGGASGAVSLNASGNVVQQTGGLIDLSGGPGLSLTIDAGAIGSATAPLLVSAHNAAAGAGTTADLAASSGGVYVRQTTGSLDLQRYLVSAPTNQTASLSSAGDLLVSSLAGLSGASGSDLLLTAGGAITITPGAGGTFRSVGLTANGAGGIGMGSGAASSWSAANGLTLTANAGDINLAADLLNTSASANATLVLAATGDVSGVGLGTQGQALSVQAGTSGSGHQINLSGTVSTRSGALPAPDGAAGTITLAAGTAGVVSAQTLETHSAAVTVTGANGVSISLVNTQGNNANPGAGSVTLTATAGTGVMVDTIQAQGQTGAASQAGGAGGNVLINTAGTGALSTTINTSGGAGGDATAAGFSGGNGGDAGTLSIQHTGALTISGTLLARGGDAGNALAGPTAAASGTVGNAQAVNITAASGLTLGALTVDNSPGNGGLNNLGTSGAGGAMQATVLAAGTGSLLQTGALNLNGQILRFSSGGSVALDNAGNSIGETDGSATGSVGIVGLVGVGDLGVTAGTTLDLINPSGTLAIQGALTAGGALGLQGTTVSVHDPVVAGGALTISATTAIDILTTAAGGSGNGGLTAPTLSLTAPTTNLYGTLTPGAAGAVGTATVNGVLNLQNGSVLNIDFNGNSHDTVTATGGFNAAPGATVSAQASTAPTSGAYTIVSGTHSGTVPTLTTNITSATLAWGSLVLTVPAPAGLPSGGGGGGAAGANGPSALDADLYGQPAWRTLGDWDAQTQGATLDETACRAL